MEKMGEYVYECFLNMFKILTYMKKVGYLHIVYIMGGYRFSRRKWGY